MIAETFRRDDPFAVAAARAAAFCIKNRARYYLRHPQALEALYPGLSHAKPAKMLAIAAHLVEREQSSPRRWFGFGGEVGLINVKAAYLSGRVLRRQNLKTGSAIRKVLR